MRKAEEIRSQVRDLVWSGRKIEAVKLYRDMTWASLVDAKNAVEAIADGKAPVPDIDWLDDLYLAIAEGDFDNSVRLLEQHTPLDRNAAEKHLRTLFGQHAVEYVYVPVDDEQAKQQIIALVKAKRKIEAIKLYKAHTGQGLAEAKNAVEKIEQDLQAQQSTTSPRLTPLVDTQATGPLATDAVAPGESVDGFESSGPGRLSRVLAFIYAIMAIVGIAFSIGLSWGQPKTVSPCRIAENVPAEEQLAQIMQWKEANIPSTARSFFVETRFIDFRFEAGLPAWYPFLEDTWENKLIKLTQNAQRTSSAFWRCIKYFVLLYALGICCAIWGCLRPRFLNAVGLLLIALAGYPNVAELPLEFHCDFAGRWFAPLIIVSGLNFLIVFFVGGFASRTKQLQKRSVQRLS